MKLAPETSMEPVLKTQMELMVAKDYWTDENMTAVNAAIAAGNGYTAS